MCASVSTRCVMNRTRQTHRIFAFKSYDDVPKHCLQSFCSSLIVGRDGDRVSVDNTVHMFVHTLKIIRCIIWKLVPYQRPVLLVERLHHLYIIMRWFEARMGLLAKHTVSASEL